MSYATKGQLIVVPHVMRATALNGAVTETKSFALAAVVSANVAGKVMAYRILGTTVQRKCHCDVRTVQLDASVIESAYVGRGDDYSREFDSLDDVRAFVLPFMPSREAS